VSRQLIVDGSYLNLPDGNPPSYLKEGQVPLESGNAWVIP